jgi:hypothetical protein
MSEATSEWSTPLHKPRSPHTSRDTGPQKATQILANPFNGGQPASRPAPVSHAEIGLPMFCNACHQSPCCCNCADTEKL